jgi:hypothetical protein
VESTLDVVVDAIRERFNAAPVPFDKPVAFGVGLTKLSEKDGPRRVVIVRKGGQITDIRTTSGPIKVKHMGRWVQFYRSYDDVMQIEAHLVAPSSSEIEMLQRRLLNVTKDMFGTSSQPGGYAVVTEADKAGVTHNGKTYAVQQFTWRVTIARERRHQLGRENASELSPKIPVTELVEINEIATVYTLLPAAPAGT